MTNVTSKKCEICNVIQPSFGFWTKTPTCCNTCKTKGMYNLKEKKCSYEGYECKNYANYALDRSNKFRYCKKHKSDQMFFIKNNLCKKCEKQPSYGFVGKRALYCDIHKEPNMIDIRSKMCIKCKEHQPYYNDPKEKNGIYCGMCKKDGMINVRDKMCIECHKTIPTYNEKGKLPMYCKDCKTQNMINVKSKRCDVCFKSAALFGILGFEATKCFRDKEKNMLYLPRKKCITNECNEFATCGLTPSKREHCKKDKVENEHEFFNSKCFNCNLTDVIVDENNLCELCDPEIFARYKSRKQLEIKNLFENNNLSNFVYDQSIDSIFQENCTMKRRPDFLFDCDTHFLILEVDEHQHSFYNEECETVRMINISQAIGMPTIFIRYNPDEYKLNERKSITTKNTKHTTLLSWVNKYKKHTRINGFCSYIKLFYDEYKSGKVEEVILQEFE